MMLTGVVHLAPEMHVYFFHELGSLVELHEIKDQSIKGFLRFTPWLSSAELEEMGQGDPTRSKRSTRQKNL